MTLFTAYGYKVAVRAPELVVFRRQQQRQRQAGRVVGGRSRGGSACADENLGWVPRLSWRPAARRSARRAPRASGQLPRNPPQAKVNGRQCASSRGRASSLAGDRVVRRLLQH